VNSVNGNQEVSVVNPISVLHCLKNIPNLDKGWKHLLSVNSL
jgi:hypothetical protein